MKPAFLHFLSRLGILIVTIFVMGIIALVSYSNPILIFLDVVIIILWYVLMIIDNRRLSKQNNESFLFINITLIAIVTIAIIILFSYIGSLH